MDYISPQIEVIYETNTGFTSKNTRNTRDNAFKCSVIKLITFASVIIWNSLLTK